MSSDFLETVKNVRDDILNTHVFDNYELFSNREIIKIIKRH